MSVERARRYCLLALMPIGLQLCSQDVALVQAKLLVIDQGDDRGSVVWQTNLRPPQSSKSRTARIASPVVIGEHNFDGGGMRQKGGATLKLTRKLIRECFCRTTKISSRFPFEGYSIKTDTGSTAILTAREIKKMRGGSDLYDGAARLAKALGWERLLATGGSLEHAARFLLAGQAIGLPVGTASTRRFFGLIEDPPVALPRPSGVLGDQRLGWTNADLKQARLLTRKCEGVRVGASWETGDPIRYAGDDAENNIVGFLAPGLGKGVAFQAPALMEFHGSAGAPRGSSFTVDPSGQLFMICAPELLRQGVRVLPIMLFPEDFPAGVRALAPRSRCINPMTVSTRAV
jgi:hypothetical protein